VEVKMEVKQKYLKTHINPINDVSKVKDDMKGLAFRPYLSTANASEGLPARFTASA
jgi:hypothetical protein